MRRFASETRHGASDNATSPLISGKGMCYNIGVFGRLHVIMCMLDEIRAKRDEIYAVARKYKAEKLWVFGSCARKEERPDSDVDFLVKFNDDASMLDLVHIKDGMQGIVMRDVDVVSSRGLSPFIGRRILSEAVAI